jgi:SAM-dependent methyltransferase
MSIRKHKFKNYYLDPIPESLWREAKAIEGTKLGFCEECGFYHLDPYPPEDYLIDFYSKYEMPTEQQNLAETARLLARNIGKDAKVLDVGCGDGGFLSEMNLLGFTNLVGFDQSPGVARAMVLDFGEFSNSNIWEYLSEVEKTGGSDADALVMVNVLEHVSEPIELLHRLYKALPKGGLLCITVPNDFSPLQQAFLKIKGHEPWFVHVPDHVNYFDFKSLCTTLNTSGFDVIDQTALYPLELFLLQDLDYVADAKLGPIAHERRVMFEENMKKAGMTNVLDKFYESLAAGGFGRDAMVVARKK